MRPVSAIWALATLLSGIASGIELQSSTVEAWDQYLQGARVRMQARLDGDAPFLWVDESDQRAARVRAGEIVVMPLVGHGTRGISNGLIHHWIGASFIPNTTIGSLLSVVHDYDRYTDIYNPVVTDSKTLSSNAGDQEFSMVWQRHVVFINAAMRGQYRARDFMVDSHRGYSIVDATRIQQIEEYRRASEHLLPPDTGDGFIWRIRSIARYEERDGGVYLEIEAMALSRDIPGSVRWLATPIVNRLSVNSLTTTLSQTRHAVELQRVTFAMHSRKRER